MKYILIWNIKDYPEMGWWTEYAIIQEEEIESKVNEIAQDSRASIAFCWWISDEIKFKPVTTVTEWRIDN